MNVAPLVMYLKDLLRLLDKTVVSLMQTFFVLKLLWVLDDLIENRLILFELCFSLVIVLVLNKLFNSLALVGILLVLLFGEELLS